MRWILVLCLLASGCIDDAEARGPGSRRMRRRGGSGVVVPPPVALDSPSALRYAYFGYGQSLWRDDPPVLSSVQPYDNVRAAGASLVDMVETTGETAASGMLNQITSIRAAENDGIAWVRYGSGAPIADISQGSALYNQSLTQAGQADTQVDLLTQTMEIEAIVMLHGSSDEIASPPTNTAAVYLPAIAALRRNFEADLASYRNPQGLSMFVIQTMAWTGFYETSEIAMQIVDLADSEPTRIILLGPDYFYVYTDAYHPTNVGHRWTGQMVGKVLEAHFFDLAPRGLYWQPLRPTSLVADGSTVRVYVRVPCLRYGTPRCGASPPLARDITLVSDRTLAGLGLIDGFRYIDTGVGIAPTLTSVTQASTCAECAADEWRIDLGLNAPARAGSSVGYADIPFSGVGTTCEPAASHSPGCNAAGNWRDTDNTAPESGTSNLANWLIGFNEPVSGGVVASGVEQIANSQALEYSDNTEYLTIADNAVFDFTTAMTVFSIVRPATGSLVASQHIAGKWVNGSSQSWLFRTDTLDTDDLIFFASTTSNFKRCTGCDLAVDTTYCVAVVYDGGLSNSDRVTIYVGPAGSSMSEPTQSVSGTIPTTLVNSTGALTFGFTSGNIAGTFDEPAVWNAALSQSTLSAICQGYTGTSKADLMNAVGLTDPVGWWPAEGDSGTTVTDATGGGRNGTLISGGSIGAPPAIP